MGRGLAAAGTLAAILAAFVLPLASGPAKAGPADDFAISGFGASSLDSQRTIEQKIRDYPSARRIETDHRYLTEKPHVAGTPRDRELARWTANEWRKAGLDDVRILEHEVLLPFAEEVSVEMVAPRKWRATLREEEIRGDPSTTADVGLTYHAYSASGEVTAPVVYAGSGNPSDYDWLAARGIDIKGKIALVRYSVPYSYRGFKALTAERRGARGIIIYSDPADDGYGRGKVYPDGPWGPASHIQRGGIVYDFMVPGDPLTPGWASVPGAKRIEAADAASLPSIISVPMSHKEARVILETLEGPETPKAWHGGLPITYRAGPGATVRIKVRNDDKVRPIWTVTGKITGSTEPDRWILLGNHRDAWVFGGVDPSSGSASMMELARTMGALAKDGHRPKRTLVFASWDAEEWTLTSSTEWGEQFEEELRRKAIAYINVDSSASGPNFTAAAVPALNRFVAEAVRDVKDPVSNVSLSDAWRTRNMKERGALPTGAGDDLVNNRLGSGSDYTVFLNFVGVPILDMAFDGPYGVYHSMYDNHQWVSRIGDPGFRYHATMTRLWGVMAARLANADALPLDYEPYAERVTEFLNEVEQRWPNTRFDLARAANARFARAAAAVTSQIREALAANDIRALEHVNSALMRAERGLLDMRGIPGRPWYRHQIYAPKFTYAPEVLPGLAEAIEAGDAARVQEQEERLAAALDRAAAALRGENTAGTIN
jgi:N-acetylated-alpha-linked acidic dipeptidase